MYGDLISVVVPAYNVADYIGECLESICRQTYRELEIIVVDDGSTDDTCQICQKYALQDRRIRLCKQENQGVVSARNTGIREATGRYLSFIDGDDWVESTMYESMVRQMADADLVSVGVFQEKAKDCFIKVADQFEKGTYEGEEGCRTLFSRLIYDEEQQILQPMTPWVYNKLYLLEKAKEAHQKVDPCLTFAEDSTFLYLYMLSCKKIVIGEGYYYHYRYREGSAVHKDDRQLLSKINKVYDILYPAFKEHEEYDLLYQQQKWTQIIACAAISSQMGFDRRVSMPRFIMDTGKIGAKKLVLYGAGRVGQDLYRQLRAFDYQVVLWVDKNATLYRGKGLDVSPAEEIEEKEFEAVYIAVESKEMAEDIRRELIGLGVEEEKILWVPPMRLY